MSTKIKITGRVLTYNAGKKVIPTLESIKLQTYPHKDLVIADDASTDNGETIRIIEKWLEHNECFFTNVHFIKNTTNLGIVKNIKNASAYAKGDIIFGLGQGDIAYSNSTFDNIAKYAEEYKKPRLPLIWLGHYTSYSQHPTLHFVHHHASLPYQLKLLFSDPQKAFNSLLIGNYIGGPSLVYSRKYYEKNIYPLPEDLDYVEDYPCLLYMTLNNHLNIGYFPFYLRIYEQGVGVSTHKNPLHKKMVASYIQSLTWILNTQRLNNKQIKTIKRAIEYYSSQSYLEKVLNSPSLFCKKLYRGIYNSFYVKYILNTESKKILSNSGDSLYRLLSIQ